MSVPDFQTLLLPALRHLVPQQLKTGALVDLLSNEFQLTEADRNELLGSGRQKRVANRTHWALAYLNRAGLIERVSRGEYKATPLGNDLVKEGLAKLTLSLLMERYPGVRAFRGGGEQSDSQQTSVDAVVTSKIPNSSIATTETPTERLENADRELKGALAVELIERVRNIDPTTFEQLIIDLLVKIGYGGTSEEAAKRLGQSGDGGIDGVIREDALGLDAIYLQAKRYKEDNAIGPATIQAFAGALLGKGATKGVFVTTSRFTPQARGVVEGLRGNQRIVLIDGEELARLMLEHEVGVRTIRTIRVQRLDLEPYEDEGPA